MSIWWWIWLYIHGLISAQPCWWNGPLASRQFKSPMKMIIAVHICAINYLSPFHTDFSCWCPYAFPLNCPIRPPEVFNVRSTKIQVVAWRHQTTCHCINWYFTTPYGPLASYIKLRVAHAPGMPGTFSPPPRFSDPDMHHGTCVTHVPWCMPGSLTSRFLWSGWQGKRSRHSRRMRNPQFYVSGKRSMVSPETSELRGNTFEHLCCLLSTKRLSDH